MVLSSAGEYIALPHRLAGTAKQYSTKALPQLATTTSHSGRSVNLKCPYQVKVMNTLDTTSSTMGLMARGQPGHRFGTLRNGATPPPGSRVKFATGSPHSGAENV